MQEFAEKQGKMSIAQPIAHARLSSLLRQNFVQANRASEDLNIAPTITAPTHLGHNFKRLRVYPGANPGDAHQIAQHGLLGTAVSLPHIDQIQRSFGSQYDLSRVKAYIGGNATTAARHLGAEAYAIGERIGFGSLPSLHIAAHEATHVIQQRMGLHLANGMGLAGDKYEQHADQVANDVIAGRSAERSLARLAKAGNSPNDNSPYLQRQTSSPPDVKMTFEQYLAEGANFFASHKGHGLGFGLGNYDQNNWMQPSNAQGSMNIIRAKVLPWDAINKLVEDVKNDRQITGPQGNPTYWSVDCLEFTQLLRIYAYWKSLTKDEFNSRFSPLELGASASTNLGFQHGTFFEASRPGQAPQLVFSTPIGGGLISPQSQGAFHKTWDDLLRVAPIGTHIEWSNMNLRNKCKSGASAGVNCSWENEHTTKVGQDQYAAWDLGVVPAARIKEEIAAASFGGDKRRVNAAFINANIFISLLEFPEQLSSLTIYHLISPVDFWGVWQQAPIPLP